MARPFVTANFALTWDARISTRNGTPADFSSKADKRRLLEIRSRADAILATAKTVAADRMTMGMPAEDLRAARRERGQSEYPLRVVLSASGRIDSRLRVFEKTFSPIVIFSTTRMPAHIRQALGSKADLRLHAGDTVNLTDALTSLRRDYAVRRLVCEGGGQLFRALLSANLVDELHLTLCARLFGGAKAPTITGIADDFFGASARCELRDMEVVEDECFLRYTIPRERSGPEAAKNIS